MTRRAAGTPAPWAVHTVHLANRALPKGPVRTRYDLELEAELYGRPAAYQLRFALGALASALTLRSAVAGGQATTIQEEIMASTKPLRCRLNIHRWHRESSEDGHGFQRCVLCGKDNPRSGSGIGGIPAY